MRGEKDTGRVMEASGLGGDALKVCVEMSAFQKGEDHYFKNEVVALLVLSAQNTWVYAQVCFRG